MSTAKQLTRGLKLNFGVLQAQLKGLTHEETLLALPFRGNCLNWILGHITVSRGGILRLLGIDLLWDATDYAAYQREAEPISDGSGALRLERIMADLSATQDALLARLQTMSDEELALIPASQERTVGEQISFLSWHETYHAGQTEFLRQLAGKDDKVI